MALLFDPGIFSIEGLSGEILAGAKLYFYESGTSTPQATYSDDGLTIANANPVVASADGRLPTIWLQPLEYKIVLKTFDDGTTLLTRDPIKGTVGGAALLVDADSFTSDTDDLAEITDTILFLQSGTGAASRSVQDKLRDMVSVNDFDATGDGVTDDAAAIQAAIDYASGIGGLCTVDLANRTYAVASTIQVKQNVVLRNGKLVYTGSTANAAIVSIGTGTSSLIRPAGIENLYASTSSTAAGVCGFRINGLVRSSWIRNCVAHMNADAAGTRKHYGFEIRSERLATTSNAGAYQNDIDGCTAINCYGGYRLYTEGNAAEQGADPQVNANRVKGWAYSCVRSAVIIEEGAIENEVDVRADTFVSQTGLGTTIYVFDVLGSQNRCVFDEEVGARADTQYTLHLGATAFWNTIDYKTQNVVTARVLNDSTTSRNTLKWLNPTQNLGGDLVTVSHYTASAVTTATTEEVREKWIAPAPCVVVRMSSVLDANVASSGSFLSYAGKNGSYSADNRLSFAVGEGTTTKHMDGDPSAGTPIGSQWVLAKGDYISLAFTNSSPNSIKATTTLAIRFLSSESNG